MGIDELNYYRRHAESVVDELLEDLSGGGRYFEKRRLRIIDYVLESFMYAHVINECSVVPGHDGMCRCDICREVCQRIAAAGLLEGIADRWWEQRP